MLLHLSTLHMPFAMQGRGQCPRRAAETERDQLALNRCLYCIWRPTGCRWRLQRRQRHGGGVCRATPSGDMEEDGQRELIEDDDDVALLDDDDFMQLDLLHDDGASSSGEYDRHQDQE